MLRPYVLSIAGFDPSAGAGILADIKCFEQHQVYGFGVCTALTLQNDSVFIGQEWLSASQIIAQLSPLLSKFQPAVCKIGLIKNIEVLLEVIQYLKQACPDIRIVLDPVLKASAGYVFHQWKDALARLSPVLSQMELITPNYDELKEMAGPNEEDMLAVATQWSAYCAVLLKGGHNEAQRGTDYLLVHGHTYTFKPELVTVYPKHGSGCVLSSAIVANMALGYALPESCKRAKLYTEQFLMSNLTLLGYHT